MTIWSRSRKMTSPPARAIVNVNIYGARRHCLPVFDFGFLFYGYFTPPPTHSFSSAVVCVFYELPASTLLVNTGVLFISFHIYRETATPSHPSTLPAFMPLPLSVSCFPSLYSIPYRQLKCIYTHIRYIYALYIDL